MNWYELDKERLVLEYVSMQRKYPKFILCKYEDKLAWEGEVNLIPDSIETVPLKVRLIYPDGYPIQLPEVYPIDPVIPEELLGHKWHRWYDGKLCFGRPELWNVRYTAVDVIVKIEIWYFNYLAFKYGLIDKMPDEGIANIPKKGDA